jgi:hypothetical protein
MCVEWYTDKSSRALSRSTLFLFYVREHSQRDQASLPLFFCLPLSFSLSLSPSYPNLTKMLRASSQTLCFLRSDQQNSDNIQHISWYLLQNEAKKETEEMNGWMSDWMNRIRRSPIIEESSQRSFTTSFEDSQTRNVIDKKNPSGPEGLKKKRWKWDWLPAPARNKTNIKDTSCLPFINLRNALWMWQGGSRIALG